MRIRGIGLDCDVVYVHENFKIMIVRGMVKVQKVDCGFFLTSTES